MWSLLLLIATAQAVSAALPEGTVILNPRWRYDIANGTVSNGTTTLTAKRTPITACEDRLWTGAAIFDTVAAASASWLAALRGIAYMVKDLSNGHNCGGAHAVFDNVKYVYSVSGQNCDTTAGVSTVIGGLHKLYVNAISEDPNSIYCIEISHAGSWYDYLLVGADQAWPGSIWCGPTTRNTCVTGGNGDQVPGFGAKRDTVMPGSGNGTAYASDGGGDADRDDWRHQTLNIAE
ncbi:hypothetical protein QEN19_003977 [Hanseniaspora menglaensis]